MARQSKNIYSRDYFRNLAHEITLRDDYVSDKELLKHSPDDFIPISSNRSDIDKKADLKNKGKRMESYNLVGAVKFYDKLKTNGLFKNDYWPYRRQCIIFKNRIKDDETDLKTIKEIFSNNIYLNQHQYIWLSNKILELISKLNLDENEIYEIYNLTQNYNNYDEPSLPIAERIIKDRDGLKLLSKEKYNYLQNIYYRKELGVGYIRRGNYENAIQYFVELLNDDLLYFRYHAYKQLGRIFEEMNNPERFKELYEKYPR